METMKAVQVGRFGGPETLTIQDVPKPQPGEGEVLVRVRATGVNPVDWKFREGSFRNLRLPFTPGGDFCGSIEELGVGVADFKVGDEVYGCTPGSIGAEAEYLKSPVLNLALKPRTLDVVRAAGVPLAGMTAWQGLFTHGLLRSGQTALVLGASGGVGAIAVQLAKLAGARVIGTASTANVDRVRALGCDVVVDYKKQRFEDFAKDVDLCLDLLGGDFQKRAYETLKTGGRLISTVQEPDEALAKQHRLTAQFFRMMPEGRQLMELARRIDSGELQITVAKVLPLERAAEAEELNRRHKVDGKIVLQVGR